MQKSFTPARPVGGFASRPTCPASAESPRADQSLPKSKTARPHNDQTNR